MTIFWRNIRAGQRYFWVEPTLVSGSGRERWVTASESKSGFDATVLVTDDYGNEFRVRSWQLFLKEQKPKGSRRD